MWHPIEIAPKLEGLTLLGFIKDGGSFSYIGPIQFVTRYDDCNGEEVSQWEVIKGAICYDNHEITSEYNIYDQEITHWMPLPELPNGQDAT
jgi:Protein of unknown function (DUF551)